MACQVATGYLLKKWHQGCASCSRCTKSYIGLPYRL